MSLDALIFALLITSIYLLLFYKRIKTNKKVITILFVLYLSALMHITVIRDLSDFINLANNSYSVSTIQLIPLKTTLGSLNFGLDDFIYNLVGNMIWFFPFGILFPLLHKKFNSYLSLTLASFLCSFSIEVLQFAFSTGVSDIDDIILNVLGSVLIYSIYRLFHKWCN